MSREQFAVAQREFLEQRWESAEALFCALAAAGDTPAERASAFTNLGVLYDRRGLREAAHASYRMAVALNPAATGALTNLGAAAVAAGNLEEAERWSRAALELNPDLALPTLNLSTVELHRGELPKAERLLERALQLDPKNVMGRFNRALLLFNQGKWKEGWVAHEVRRDLPAAVRLHTPESPKWKGESLRGKRLLVLSEQGHGDCIQWARFLPEARRRSGATLVLECYRPLQSLFEAQGVADELYPLGAALPPHDRHCFIASLPHLFGAAPPAPSAAYLRVERRQLSWEQPRPRVGIVWKGAPEHLRDRTRSLPQEALEQLVRLRGVSWVSLQHDSIPPFGVADLRDSLPDFQRLGQYLLELDLLVAVDTAPLHLAGALGTPCWGLLAKPAEWRWGQAGETCPWYSSVRLFRQPSKGDWRSVVQQVHEELRRHFGLD